MIKQFFLLVVTFFGHFFQIGSGFLADPDSGKKVRSGSEKNPDPKHYKVENVLVPQIDPLT